MNSLKEVENGAVVCVLDFAENYTCSNQGEVQNAYYSRNSVTLHTIVATYKSDDEIICDSVVFVSGDLKHDWGAVYSFVRLLCHHPQMVKKDATKLILWSDGCSAQYKSRQPFYSIAVNYNQTVPIEWNWFSSGHDKAV